MKPNEDRWRTFKDVLLFQGKLLLDGVRDLVLSPVSIVAALIDLAVPGDDRGRRFYSVLRLGRRTEEWIDLFSAADRHDTDVPLKGIDAAVEALEAVVRDPARREEAREKARLVLQRLQENNPE